MEVTVVGGDEVPVVLIDKDVDNKVVLVGAAVDITGRMVVVVVVEVVVAQRSISS